jgi:hypothetical protein
MHETTALNRLAVVQRLLKSIKDEPGLRVP